MRVPCFQLVVIAAFTSVTVPASAQILSFEGEQLVSASSGYAYNQRPRVMFTDDGASHIMWVRGNVFAQEGVFALRSALGDGNYGAPVMISDGLHGVRYGPGDGLTMRHNGDYLVVSWEGVDFADRPIWFARSTDAGLTWENALHAEPDSVVERAYTAGTPFADGRIAQVWMVYEEGTGLPDLRWSAQDGNGDFGAPSWPAENAPMVPCECCNPDQLVLDDGTVLVAFRNNDNNRRRIYVARSTDGGATWPNPVRLDTSGALFFVCPSEAPSVAVDGQDVLVLWAKMPGFPPNAHVWAAVSSDGGQTFSGEIPVDDSDGSTSTRQTEVARRGDFAVAVWTAEDPLTTHDEIWTATSINGGLSWGTPQMITGDGLDLPIGQPSVGISPTTLEVEIVWRDNRDGTEKIYRIRGALDATGAEVIPASPVRLTAAPNPFGTRTTLRFALPDRSDARLVIHDVSGRQVAELRRPTMPAGPAQVTWDGKSASGRPVGAGVYYVRLESSAGTESVRLVLVR